MSDILARFAHVIAAADDRWTARCPAHEDARSSLSIGRGDDGRWLLKCHAGCTLDAILAAVHLQPTALFPEPRSNGRRVVATYPYADEQRTLLFNVLRYENPKDFRQRAADGSWSLKGIRRVLYHLADIQGRSTVFVTEGEKDADLLWSLGLPATCNAGGAGKWRDEFAAMLVAAGCRQVVILPDNDPAGETHGRDVARSCAAANLEVKLIPLPGLPRKGDVSDYLRVHSKEELLALVKEAPLFTPHRLVAAPQPITLTSLSDLIGEPDDLTEWLVEDRIPAGGVVLLPAPPKAGKSTFSRHLGLCVARGEPFLGWRTTPGPVWFLIFEDKRSEVRRHFQRMGATGQEPIRLFIDQAPIDIVARLHELAARERPALIVVDILGRALRLKDFNDYAEVTRAFEPLLKLSRTTGATLLLLHHGSAHVQREGLDAVLGSTALSGSVDNILILRRTDQQRVLSSIQRIGPDLEPTVIVMNAETGRLERAGSKRDVDDVDLGRHIVAVLAGLPAPAEPVPEKWIQANTEGRHQDKVRVLRRLVGTGEIRRVGAGGKGDPFHYALAFAGSRDSAGGANSPNRPEPQEPEKRPANTGLFDPPDLLVPEVPTYISGTNKCIPTTYEPYVVVSAHDSDLLVPEVPEHFGNRANETPETAIGPDKHGSDAGSQLSGIGPKHERF